MLQGRWGTWGEKLDRLTWPSLPHVWGWGTRKFAQKGRGFLHLFLQHMSAPLVLLRLGGQAGVHGRGQ